MVVFGVLGHDKAKVPLAERDNPRETLRLDRADEPLRVRVQVRTARRQLDGLNAPSAQDPPEFLSKQRIAVVDQMSRAAEEPLAGLVGK